MATIIGSVASSHTPTIGYAFDQNKQTDPAWRRSSKHTRRYTLAARKQPDVVFYIFNDHVTSFFFDHYSPFALGIGLRIRRR